MNDERYQQLTRWVKNITATGCTLATLATRSCWARCTVPSMN